MKIKALIPSFCMLLVATILLTTTTYAWFSMNARVFATGIDVLVKAEDGIVITNESKEAYGESATTTAVASQLVPASTANIVDWYHSSSNSPAVANTGNSYTTDCAVGTHYVKSTFYIRCSSANTLTVSSLDISAVEVGSSSQNASKSLRVAIKFAGDSNVYIYAPVAGFTTTYTVNGGVTVTPKSSSTVTHSTITSIPNNTQDGVQVDVYVWYEGEDAACISNNLLASMEHLVTTVTFTFTAAS